MPVATTTTVRAAVPVAMLDALDGNPLTGSVAEVLRTSLDSTPAVAVRLNPARVQGESVELPLGAPVPWHPHGRYVEGRPRFTMDPMLHQGVYYVQDPSSMAVAAAVASLLRDDMPVTVLDACAAPGGKSTAILPLLPEGSLLIANEYVRQRASILHENLAKWGDPKALTCSMDTSLFAGLPPVFDIIVADVPCSGEGMMRKDMHAREQWTPALVNECAALQREIVRNLWPALKPGGCLVYSTCTFNAYENEQNVSTLAAELQAHIVPLDGVCAHYPDSGITAQCGMLRLTPGMVDGEGQFVALLRKSASTEMPRFTERRAKRSKQAKPDIPDEARSYLRRPELFELRTDGETVRAWPREATALPEQLQEVLRPVLKIGEIRSKGKGSMLVPAQELALSTMLDTAGLTVCDVDRDTAVEYLRRQAVKLPDAPKGIVLLRYGGRPLGWANNLGNRANNLYPKQWRILSQQ